MKDLSITAINSLIEEMELGSGKPVTHVQFHAFARKVKESLLLANNLGGTSPKGSASEQLISMPAAITDKDAQGGQIQRFDLDQQASNLLRDWLGDEDDAMPIILWIGEAFYDGGASYGLNVSSADDPQEGCVQLLELPHPVLPGAPKENQHKSLAQGTEGEMHRHEAT